MNRMLVTYSETRFNDDDEDDDDSVDIDEDVAEMQMGIKGIEQNAGSRDYRIVRSRRIVRFDVRKS